MAARRRKAPAKRLGNPTRADYAGWLAEIEIEGEKTLLPDYPRIALDYAQRCVDGKNLVCRFVKLAAERYLRMMKQAEARRGCTWYFDPMHVFDVCSFLEKLPHVEGEWETPTITLEPWQIWMLAAIYGFRRKADGTRLVRWVYMEVPRKSGKSSALAGLALYALTSEGENAPSIYIGAPTLEQAKKVFAPAANMVRRDGDLMEAFGLKPKSREIECEATYGQIQLITAVGEHQDGHNPHMVILEELHAQNPALYQVMRSSFGARKNPLFFQITTAGRVAAGICWDQRKRAIRVLERVENAPEVFACIYTVDKEDRENLFDERVLIKANPMWGVSVDPVKAMEYASEVRFNPSGKAEFLRTRLNDWMNAADRLFTVEQWESCADAGLAIGDYKGATAWIGVDLASRRDMAAITAILETETSKLAIFSKFYVPSDAPAFFDPDLMGMYQAWVEGGFVTSTGPGMIDFETIEADIKAWCQFFQVKAIALDPYQAQMLAQNLAKEGLPAVLFPNTPKNMTEPTDDLSARVTTGELVHDGHPILQWHATNVVAYRDQKGNVLPKKDAPNSVHKIDGFHAAVFANGCRLQGKEPDKKKVRKQVYSRRGLHGAPSTPAQEA